MTWLQSHFSLKNFLAPVVVAEAKEVEERLVERNDERPNIRKYTILMQRSCNEHGPAKDTQNLETARQSVRHNKTQTTGRNNLTQNRFFFILYSCLDSNLISSDSSNLISPDSSPPPFRGEGGKMKARASLTECNSTLLTHSFMIQKR